MFEQTSNDAPRSLSHCMPASFASNKMWALASLIIRSPVERLLNWLAALVVLLADAKPPAVQVGVPLRFSTNLGHYLHANLALKRGLIANELGDDNGNLYGRAGSFIRFGGLSARKNPVSSRKYGVWECVMKDLNLQPAD